MEHSKGYVFPFYLLTQCWEWVVSYYLYTYLKVKRETEDKVDYLPYMLVPLIPAVISCFSLLCPLSGLIRQPAVLKSHISASRISWLFLLHSLLCFSSYTTSFWPPSFKRNYWKLILLYMLYVLNTLSFFNIRKYINKEEKSIR